MAHGMVTVYRDERNSEINSSKVDVENMSGEKIGVKIAKPLRGLKWRQD